MSHLRSIAWLSTTWTTLANDFFPEVDFHAIPSLTYARRSTQALGRIAVTADTIAISVNGICRYEDVPDFVIMGTLAHETQHYAHYFSQTQAPAAPHRGGIIERDLHERGLGDLMEQRRIWLDTCWDSAFHTCTADLRMRRESMEQKVHLRFQQFRRAPGRRNLDEIAEILGPVWNILGVKHSLMWTPSVRGPLVPLRYTPAAPRLTETSVNLDPAFIYVHPLLADPSISARAICGLILLQYAMQSDLALWQRIENYALPEGTVTNLVLYGSHWQRKVWPDIRKHLLSQML